MEKIRGFYPVWKWFLQERLLNDASQRGLQLKKAGLFSVGYEFDETKAYRHRIIACEAAKGSASRLQFELAWQREGWEKVCRRGKLLYYRSPAEKKCDEPKDNDLLTVLRRSIHRWEVLRLVLLVLSALCIVAGYAIDLFWVVRLSVIPLAIALLLTLVIDRLQKAKARCEK